MTAVSLVLCSHKKQICIILFEPYNIWTDLPLCLFCLFSVGMDIVKLDLIVNVLIVYCKVGLENDYFFHYYYYYYYYYCCYAQILNSFHMNKHCCMNNK